MHPNKESKRPLQKRVLYPNKESERPLQKGVLHQYNNSYNIFYDLFYKNQFSNVEQHLLTKYLQSETSGKIDTMIKKYIYKTENYQLPDNLNILYSTQSSVRLIQAFYYAVQKIEKKIMKVSNNNTTRELNFNLYKVNTRFVPNTVYSENDVNVDTYIITSPENPSGNIYHPKNIRKTFNYLLLDGYNDKKIITGESTVNPWKYNYYQYDNFCEVSSLSPYGLKGFRIGYAIVKNPIIYKYMFEYIHGNDRDTFFLYNQNVIYWSKIFLNNIIIQEKNLKIMNQLLRKRQTEIKKIVPKSHYLCNDNVPYATILVSKDKLAENNIEIVNNVYPFPSKYTKIFLLGSNNDWKKMLNVLEKIFK